MSYPFHSKTKAGERQGRPQDQSEANERPTTQIVSCDIDDSTKEPDMLSSSGGDPRLTHDEGVPFGLKPSGPSNNIGPTTVLEISLTELDGTIVGLSGQVEPKHFRLLDCDAFLDSQLLRVLQFPEFTPKDIRYAAVSYPWRDLQLLEGTQPPMGCFSVQGAEHADPITIGVLRTACLATRQFGVSLLWLDRLCIMQSSRIDKDWQITHMFMVYVHADPCLILPGGLVRLANVSEPTTWLDRAWTLQESAANINRDSIKCVFAFPYDTFADFAKTLPNIGYSTSFWNSLLQAQHPAFTQHIIEPGYSAACNLLDLCTEIQFSVEKFEFHDPELAKDYRNFPLRILYAPAANLLSHALVYNRTINYQYLWMSAFVRSSSRPVDMVFSFMGLMGVQLPVSSFSPNDRAKATIKLIQAWLEQGHPAKWLFIAPELPPSPELSILPAFPETSESGRAMVNTPQGLKFAFEEIGLKEPWRDNNAPKGVMSDEGYFTFRSRGARVVGVSTEGLSSTLEKEVWGIVIGWKKEFNRDPATGLISMWDPDHPFPVIMELVLMFVEKHGADANGAELYHRVGMENLVDEKKTEGWSWVEREFSVGGPGQGDRIRFGIGETGPVYA
ncbi:hypothetical protein BDZ94DRAFT_1248542 [Collybia nuda]|uniref:Heterokaryon incompatibility domain-containing protein n=1 Tax=Collybia nuda TaxID=64659 RepID=A0A9P5YEV8_9AGAR|nr:hypothetical protein BDZ94DRAFT_1248542 [Collybia nuda]